MPYTPGWNLVGTVDQLGVGMTGFELRQLVVAMPHPRVLHAVQMRAPTEAYIEVHAKSAGRRFEIYGRTRTNPIMPSLK